ncbi:MAG: hypothetical protein K0S18_351 [Anaerocolumna sp.]|jgi:hypothetical protein|nr:hypothetical protein [Anaerocolumna sp.]
MQNLTKNLLFSIEFIRITKVTSLHLMVFIMKIMSNYDMTYMYFVGFIERFRHLKIQNQDILYLKQRQHV